MAGDQRNRVPDRRLDQRFTRVRRVGEDRDSPPLKAAPQRSDVSSLDDDDRHPGCVQLFGDPVAQVVQPADDDVTGHVTGQDCHRTSIRMFDPATLDALSRPSSLVPRPSPFAPAPAPVPTHADDCSP